MIKRAGYVFAALAVGFADPVAAYAPTDPTELDESGGLSDRQFQSEMTAVQRRLAEEDCPGAMALLDPLLPRATGDRRTTVQLLRMICFSDQGQFDALTGVHTELAETAPDNPMVQLHGVIVALNRQQFEIGAERMIMLAENNPQALQGLNGWAFRGIGQKLTEEENYELIDRLHIALAAADWQPIDMPEMREAIALGAIDAHLADGEEAVAREYLHRVTTPGPLIAMAIDRHYETLWTDVGNALGPQRGRAVDDYAREKLGAFADNPDDARTLRDAVRAYAMLGRYREAADLGERVEIGEGLGEEAMETLRLRAVSLLALGETDAAIAVLEPAAALDPAQSFFAASAIVTLAEFLDVAQRPDDALRVTREGLESLGDRLSENGRGWLRRTEICALSALGRTAEAAPLADALASDRAQNEAAAIEALLCFGDDERAAEIAIESLATRRGAEFIADQFQPDAALGTGTTFYLREQWQRLLQRDDVREAFDARLRILPREYWPAEDPRPIPRAPVPDGLPMT